MFVLREDRCFILLPVFIMSKMENKVDLPSGPFFFANLQMIALFDGLNRYHLKIKFAIESH